MSVSRSTLVVVGVVVLLSLLAGFLAGDPPIRAYLHVRSAPVAQLSPSQQLSDKKANLLWRNIGSGQNAAWIIDGLNYAGAIPLPRSEPNWMIVGEGDFDGDKQADILWRNSVDGQNTIWFVNGGGFSRSSSLTSIGDLNWRVAATDDFNGDGKTDILWRNSSDGAMLVWVLDGGKILNTGGLPTISNLSWMIAGTGDFDGDGRADILWRNTATGQNTSWLIDGVTFVNDRNLPAISDQSWVVVATGDFNGDRTADILWRNNSSGQNTIWFINRGGGFSGSSGNPGPVADVTWKIVRAGDFNDDGKADILWRNTNTGQNAIWLMNGATLLQGGGLFTVADQNWKLIGEHGSS